MVVIILAFIVWYFGGFSGLNSAAVGTSGRPQFVPEGQGVMEIIDPGISGVALRGIIDITATIPNNTIKITGATASIFKDSKKYTLASTTSSIICGNSNGWIPTASTTFPAKVSCKIITNLLTKQTNGTTLPSGKYAIGMNTIKWSYGDRQSYTSSGDTIGWRTLEKVYVEKSKSSKGYAEFAIVGTPRIIKSSTPIFSGHSTTTLTADFMVNIKAVDADIFFGGVGSTTPTFKDFEVFRNGVLTNISSASLVSYSIPSSGVVTAGLNQSWIIQEGNQITIPVSIYFEGRTAQGSLVPSGSYAIGLSNIRWQNPISKQMTSFTGNPLWRTSNITFP